MSCVAIALLLQKYMNYPWPPSFVLQLDTKNTLKLTPLDTEVFLTLLLPKALKCLTCLCKSDSSHGLKHFRGYKQVSY